MEWFKGSWIFHTVIEPFKSVKWGQFFYYVIYKRSLILRLFARYQKNSLMSSVKPPSKLYHMPTKFCHSSLNFSLPFMFSPLFHNTQNMVEDAVINFSRHIKVKFNNNIWVSFMKNSKAAWRKIFFALSSPHFCCQ